MTQSMSRHGYCWERQCADGAVVQELEDGVNPCNGVLEPSGSEAGYQLLTDELLQLAAST